MTIETKEYAQLAAKVYMTTDANKLAPPPDWEPLEIIPDLSDGFSAGVFRRIGTTEIVIAFTGTNASKIAAGDGLLVLDRNQSGVVGGLGDLFGTTSMDGFAELQAFDANHGNQIDANDSVYAKLQVWQDANGDGISQAGELKSLTELRIDSISLVTTPGATEDADNLIGSTAGFMQRASDGVDNILGGDGSGRRWNVFIATNSIATYECSARANVYLT